MTSLRTTNALLAVIAVCLVSLTAKFCVPEAHAQPTPTPGNTFVSGCSFAAGSTYCVPVKLRVDEYGNLMVKTAK